MRDLTVFRDRIWPLIRHTKLGIQNGMAISDWIKKLKAYARRRNSFQVTSSGASSSSAKPDCLEQIAKAILQVRQRDVSLKDRPVIESLKFEVGQSHNIKVKDMEVYRAIVQVRHELSVESNEWRKAVKAMLKLAGPVGAADREPTQLLDLLETISR